MQGRRILYVLAGTAAGALLYPAYAVVLFYGFVPLLGPPGRVAPPTTSHYLLLASWGVAMVGVSIAVSLDERNGNLNNARWLCRAAGWAGLITGLPLFLSAASFLFSNPLSSGGRVIWLVAFAKVLLLLAGPCLVVPWSFVMLVIAQHLGREIRRQPPGPPA